MYKRLIPLACVVSSLACGSPKTPNGGGQLIDITGSSDTADSGPRFGQDVKGPGDATATGDTSGDGVGPAGKGVWLAFAVDDSANQTFGNGDIQWTGSFSWTQKTNSIVPATSWLPTDGPYPVLYDDGPIAKGGHEQDDGVAGDHILSTKVWFVPDADITLEYGALNEFNHWMWIGPNGQILVPKTASGTIQVPGMKLKKFGLSDVKLTLALSGLNEKFKLWADGSYKFFVKGTMDQWTPVQLLDDGQKGDDKAGDGVLTYVQSEHLSKHVGLIPAGDEVQFIFVATQGDDEPENGQEYKAATEAYKEGVTAWTAGEKGGAWLAAPVVLSQDSKGKFLNTAIVVPAGQTTGCTPACASDETCTDSKCVKNPPVGCTPACASDETCADNKCVKNPPVGCSPACASDETCTDNKCVKNPPVGCNPACASDETCTDNKCVKNPAVLTVVAVEPSKGWTTGGQVVSVTGSGFGTGAGVTFSGAAGAEVTVAGDGKSLTVKTPAHESGLVDVVVKNADGKSATLANGFYFELPKPTAPTLTGVTPSFAAAKGSEVKLLGENLIIGTTVQFVSSFNGKKYDAKSVAVVAGGLQVQTPAMPPLPVDVVVTPPGKTALTLVKALDIQPIDVPNIDGTVGPDWNAYSLAALGTLPSAWGEGKNELATLYVAYDKNNLYFGIKGKVEAGNAIVAYLDVDYGNGTGVLNPVDLKDNSGAVDDAVAGVLKTADAKIGLDFAFATVGMASFDGVDVATSTAAGWRNLANVLDFAWLNGPVKAAVDKDQFEASIPLATIYPNGVPAAGVKLKYVIVLGNKDGSAVSNQFLPAQEGAPDATTLVTWGNLTVYPVP